MLSDALPLNHASDYKEQKVWNQNCLGENLDMVTKEVGKVAANRYMLLCHDLEKIGSRIPMTSFSSCAPSLEDNNTHSIWY